MRMDGCFLLGVGGEDVLMVLLLFLTLVGGDKI